MATFKPVWVSTVEHVNKLHELYANASSLSRLFGVYDLPEGFPYGHLYWGILPVFKAPLALIASGVVEIDGAELSFRSQPMPIFGSQIHNLRTDLAFHLQANELVSVERYTAASPALSYFNLPFTRVRSQQAGLLSDFLLCVGGTGPFMNKVRARSEEFAVALTALANNVS